MTYLNYGLKSFNIEKLCNVSCICASDLITIYKQNLRNFIPGILQNALNISLENYADKYIKKTCIIIYTDSILYCPNEIIPFIDEIMKVINFAITYCCIVPSINVIFYFIFRMILKILNTKLV